MTSTSPLRTGVPACEFVLLEAEQHVLAEVGRQGTPTVEKGKRGVPLAELHCPTEEAGLVVRDGLAEKLHMQRWRGEVYAEQVSAEARDVPHNQLS
jgi:hypothetical protein